MCVCVRFLTKDTFFHKNCNFTTKLSNHDLVVALKLNALLSCFCMIFCIFSYEPDFEINKYLLCNCVFCPDCNENQFELIVLESLCT